MFIAVCGAAALAVLLLLPGLKEGFSRSDLAVIAGVVAGLAALGGLWWYLAGAAWSRAAGLAVLTAPVVAHLLVGWQLIHAQLRGFQLARQVTIENYREAPILWDGFDGPVGLAVAFDLLHPDGTEGMILAPEIRMGRALEIPGAALVATHTSGSGYFKDRYLRAEVGDLTLLKPVLFQELYEEEVSRRMAPGGVTQLTYHLHPGTVDYLASRARLCLATASAGIARCTEGQTASDGCLRRGRRSVDRPIYSDGSSLAALWVIAGRHDMTADLSPVLSQALRRHSALEGDPDSWRRMQLRLEPEGLRRAGYELCAPGRDSHTSFRVCFCRPPE